MFFYSMIFFYACVLSGAEIKKFFVNDEDYLKLVFDSNEEIYVPYKFLKQSETLKNLITDCDYVPEEIPLVGYSSQYVERLFRTLEGKIKIPSCEDPDFFSLAITANKLEMNEVIKIFKEKFLNYAFYNNDLIPDYSFSKLLALTPASVMQLINDNPIIAKITPECGDIFDKKLVAQNMYKLYEPLKALAVMDLMQKFHCNMCYRDKFCVELSFIYHKEGGVITTYDIKKKKLGLYDLMADVIKSGNDALSQALSAENKKLFKGSFADICMQHMSIKRNTTYEKSYEKFKANYDASVDALTLGYYGAVLTLGIPWLCLHTKEGTLKSLFLCIGLTINGLMLKEYIGEKFIHGENREFYNPIEICLNKFATQQEHKAWQRILVLSQIFLLMGLMPDKYDVQLNIAQTMLLICGYVFLQIYLTCYDLP